MQSWVKVWREGVSPSLSTKVLFALRALVSQGTIGMFTGGPVDVESDEARGKLTVQKPGRFVARYHSGVVGEGETVRDCLNSYCRKWQKRMHKTIDPNDYEPI